MVKMGRVFIASTSLSKRQLRLTCPGWWVLYCCRQGCIRQGYMGTEPSSALPGAGGATRSSRGPHFGAQGGIFALSLRAKWLRVLRRGLVLRNRSLAVPKAWSPEQQLDYLWSCWHGEVNDTSGQPCEVNVTDWSSARLEVEALEEGNYSFRLQALRRNSSRMADAWWWVRVRRRRMPLVVGQVPWSSGGLVSVSAPLGPAIGHVFGSTVCPMPPGWSWHWLLTEDDYILAILNTSVQLGRSKGLWTSLYLRCFSRLGLQFACLRQSVGSSLEVRSSDFRGTPLVAGRVLRLRLAGPEPFGAHGYGGHSTAGGWLGVALGALLGGRPTGRRALGAAPELWRGLGHSLPSEHLRLEGPPRGTAELRLLPVPFANGGLGELVDARDRLAKQLQQQVFPQAGRLGAADLGALGGV